MRNRDEIRVDGLDIDNGLELYNGDEDIYFSVLRSVADSIPDRLCMIMQTDDLDKYAVVVHGMKGSFRGVGAEGLGVAAEKLEIAALSGDTGFIAAHNASFVEAVRVFLEKVDDLFIDGGEQN